jgi:hypothetical protein
MRSSSRSRSAASRGSRFMGTVAEVPEVHESVARGTDCSAAQQPGRCG